jgi:hypothetical protein
LIVHRARQGLAEAGDISRLDDQIEPQPVLQQTRNLPIGAILIPDAHGVCHLHALENAAGRIDDYGIVDCSTAVNEMSAAWRRATNMDAGIEVSKSFRHESDR